MRGHACTCVDMQQYRDRKPLQHGVKYEGCRGNILCFAAFFPVFVEISISNLRRAAFNALSKIFYSVVIVECFMHIRKNAKVPRNINQVRIFRTNYSSPVYNCSSFTISINVVSIAGIKFDSYSNGNIFADWLQCLITKATSDQLAML